MLKPRDPRSHGFVSARDQRIDRALLALRRTEAQGQSAGTTMFFVFCKNMKTN
jgi:hypothetical protein